MDKDRLRQKMIAIRDQATPSLVYKEGQKLQELILAWPIFQQAQSIGCYVSVANEADTHRLLTYAFSVGKKVSVPVTRTKGQMDFQQIFSLEELKPVRFGLLEPIPEIGRQMNPEHLELMLVPGVAFDRQGNRLGFGSGYYDRFLNKSSAIRAGVALSFQIQPHIPIEKHDVQMNWLITENEIISCHPKT